MLFKSRQSPAERARKQALDLIEQARESGEEALAAVSEAVERAVRPRVAQATETVESVLAPRVARATETVESMLAPRVARAADYLSARAPEPARSSSEDAMSFINGLVIGAVIAAIAAYLLAPMDGATLRRRLRAQIDALMGRSSIEETERDAAAAPDAFPAAGPAVDQTAAAATASGA